MLIMTVLLHSTTRANRFDTLVIAYIETFIKWINTPIWTVGDFFFVRGTLEKTFRGLFIPNCLNSKFD